MTLLHAFVATSALICVLGALVLGSVLQSALRGQALDDAEQALAQYTNGVLSSRLVSGARLRVGPKTTTVVRNELSERPDIVSVKVWRADGVLAWTTLHPERIGRQFPLSADLRSVLRTGEAESSLESLQDLEDASEASLGIHHVVEVYAPVRAAGKIIGAYEVYADAGPLESSIAGRKHIVWLATGAVFLALWALLMLLARTASETLRRQRTTLHERSVALGRAYEQLEQSALEAIESLNAAVEAKDPYTAGHSARVQQIALAIGVELGLSPRELDALRLGGLFHDIGKLAVPDAILTKPARLTEEEYELVKRHSAEGARIVGKLGRLRESVPVVRHHHERWDGTGYPDGLAGDDIPPGAAAAGLADAWDAMTTDRPYQPALPVDVALGEIRRGRGTQFSPAAVDAFLAAFARSPAPFVAAGRETHAAVG